MPGAIPTNPCFEHYLGARSELQAAAYYLSLNFNVYMPVMQHGPIDFVVDAETKLFKVQVKTATWVKSGTNWYLQCRTRLVNKYGNAAPHELYDILFVVYEDRMWEIPASLITSTNLCLDGSNPQYATRTWDPYIVAFPRSTKGPH